MLGDIIAMVFIVLYLTVSLGAVLFLCYASYKQRAMKQPRLKIVRDKNDHL